MRSQIMYRKKEDYQLTQSQKDAEAYSHTHQVLKEKQNFNKEKATWIPKSINDENAIFSKKMPHKKPMKKQNELKTISINIFEVPSDFKPHSKKTQNSNRSSHLFSDDQEEKIWRSTSKKSQVIPFSKEENRKNCFKPAQTPLKRSSIDLSWHEESSKKKIRRSRYSSKGVVPPSQTTTLFQGKRRVNSTQINRSSIVFG